MRGTNGISRVLNQRLGVCNVGRWACVGLFVFAAGGIAIVQTSSGAVAQTERAADGLPIYDDRLGPPRSRLIDIDPPASVASPAAEAPATSESVALRPPTRPETVPERPTPATEEPMVDEPVPVAESPSVPVEEPAVEAPVSTDSVAETAPKPETAAPPQPEPEPTVTAAVEPSATPQTSTPATPGTIAVLFPAGGAELPGDAESQLDSVVAALDADAAVRLQLKAYADGADGAASAARRLSLSRALAVRGYLIDAGVSSTRIDVRALGSKFESGPADRVDVISVK